MEKLSPIQQLDEVLRYLVYIEHENPKVTDGDIFSYMRTKFPQLKDENIFGTELHRVLDKLIDDKYVKPYGHAGSNLPFKYGITFDGRYFITETGGYQQKSIVDAAERIRLKALETSQHDVAKKLNILTGWIAGGTIALALIELVKMAIEYHWFSS
jgi:hypothetical protein